MNRKVNEQLAALVSIISETNVPPGKKMVFGKLVTVYKGGQKQKVSASQYHGDKVETHPDDPMHKTDAEMRQQRKARRTGAGFKQKLALLKKRKQS